MLTDTITVFVEINGEQIEVPTLAGIKPDQFLGGICKAMNIPMGVDVFVNGHRSNEPLKDQSRIMFRQPPYTFA